MADVDQLFGSDSEDEKPSGSGAEANKSGSGSSSGSSSDSSDGSGDEKGSAPASPAGSNKSAASGPASPATGRAKASPAPASPARSGGPASPDGSGSSSSSDAESDKSGSKPGSPPGSPRGTAPASPTKSGSGSDSAPGTPTPGSPGSKHGSDNEKNKSPIREKSGSASPGSAKGSTTASPKQKADGSGSDSDIPTSRKKALLGSDSGSDDEEGSKPTRQRLPSDSGSDPEAVRATAEDIFGEADDISDDEGKAKEQEEEKEEEIPETRIEVEIPRVVADLGKSLSFAKLPNFLSVETRPFDPNSYEDEIDEDEVMDEEGRARLKLKVENTIRWRYSKDTASGELVSDEFGEKIRETNAKVIKWSDGSMSLHLGTEIFDVFSMPMQDHNHLYIRQGTGLQGQAMFRSKLSFRPHSTDSYTHRKMTMSLADRSTKSAKIKVLPIAGVDPELSKTDNIKKEEERLRASIRRENQQRRTKERAHARHGLSASFLDDDDSIAAIKNKYKKTKAGARPQNYSSDSADEEYETDGEEDMRRNRLQKAKRLADSDSDNSIGSGDEGPKKKTAKVVSEDDESD